MRTFVDDWNSSYKLNTFPVIQQTLWTHLIGLELVRRLDFFFSSPAQLFVYLMPHPLCCLSNLITQYCLLDCIANTTYVDTDYCYRLSSMVCQSVTLVSPAKRDESIEMPFGLRTWESPENIVLDVQIPLWEGAIFWGRRGIPLWSIGTLICAKTAEPIEMPFGLWVGICPGNQKLDAGPDTAW